ncbi:MAG: hypothetical protein JWL69_1784 [Phycisphaerales bacterium]|jgi:cytoskeletal protein CcmA (bactofilin family)|nr:hypothetical protein [Phycisphaerales bacterium]MDB5355979.1 hypothetical protein [Phycisphaerales bacterium]
MREERGNLAGDLAINEPMTLWGSIAGDVTAGKGSKFYCRGTIYGNLTVEPGGRVHIFGNITGNLVIKEKTKVIVSGVLGSDVTNLGGRLYIDATAQVMGKVRTQSGETTIEPQARIAGE